MAEQVQRDERTGSTPAERSESRESQAEEASGRAVAGDRRIAGDRRKKMVTPAARRQALDILRGNGLSERG